MAVGDSALLMKISHYLPDFSNMERRIADYILAHPKEVIHLSITELASRSNASDATIVRFCKRLGMQGYQELRVALAQDVVSPIESIHEDVAEGDSGEILLHKVFQSTIHALQYTLRIVDPRQFDQAVAALNQAGRVAVFGCGNSAAIAQDLQHKLMRVGVNATAYSDSHMQCIAAIALKAGDVCVAISHSGSSKDVVDAVSLCRERGVTVICMTNIGLNPLSGLSHIRLDTASKETEYHIVALASRISQYAIIDSLYTALALLRRPSQREDLNRVEKALSKKKH